MTMYVVDVVEHYGHVTVTANINGNFDRRGLPDPLVFVFYFSAAGCSAAIAREGNIASMPVDHHEHLGAVARGRFADLRDDADKGVRSSFCMSV